MVDKNEKLPNIQVFYFQLSENHCQRSIRINIANIISVSAVCTSDDYLNDSKVYMAILREEIFEKLFDTQITIELYANDLEIRYVTISKDMFTSKNPIYFNVNGNEEKYEATKDSSTEYYITELEKTDLKDLLNKVTLFIYDNALNPDFIQLFQTNFIQENIKNSSDKDTFDTLNSNTFLSRSTIVTIIFFSRLEKFIVESNCISNVEDMSLFKFISQFKKLMDLSDKYNDQIEENKQIKNAYLQICLHSTRVLLEKSIKSPISSANAIMESFLDKGNKLRVISPKSDNETQTLKMISKELDNNIDKINASSYFVNHFFNLIKLFGLNTDQSQISKILSEKKYILIECQILSVFGLSGFDDEVIIFVETYDSTKYKLANNQNLRLNLINRLTATYFHEMNHNIIRKLMQNEYVISPRGEKIKSKIEAGYLAEIVLFGGMTINEEIRTDVNNFDKDYINEKVFKMNENNILNSGIKYCCLKPFFK